MSSPPRIKCGVNSGGRTALSTLVLSARGHQGGDLPYAMWRYFVAHLARLGHAHASMGATLALCDVETLLADALDFVLELDGKCRDVCALALCPEGIRLASHFLKDKPEVLALRAAFLERVEE